VSAHSCAVARSPSIRDDQILEAARDLFLDRGFGISTAEIAARAGVSEGTLFKRFPTKAHLFLEAMDMGSVDDFVRFVEGLDAASTLEEAMVQAVQRIVEKMRTVLPRMMMLWANVAPGQLARSTDDPHPVRVLRALTAWLEREVARGRVRADDPRLVARVLLGASVHFAFFEIMGFDAQADADAFARGLARTLIRGVGDEAAA